MGKYLFNGARWQGQESRRGRRQRGISRSAQVGRRRVCAAPEYLEPRYLLSFSNAGSVGGSQASWTDFDNDGWSDLLAGGTLYRNVQGNLTQFQGLGGGGVWGDFNNDGFNDYYNHSGNTLWQNNGGTSFTNVSSMLPNLDHLPSRLGSSFGDFNGDGFLDLYVGGYETWPSAYYPDVLMLNNAGQSFSIAWTQGNDAVITGGRPRPARGVHPFDYDEDGDLDIYVSNYRIETNALWQNDGNGNITDVGGPTGSDNYLSHTIGSSIGDIDSDGHLDIFVGNFSHARDNQKGGQFLRNTGPDAGSNFQLMLEFNYNGAHSGDWQESYASSSLADYDNDGDLDLYFTTVYGGDNARLYTNNGGWNFSNVTGGEGLGGQPATYQAAWADYDNDGDLDLATSGVLYRNDSTGNNYLEVTLRGDGVNVSTTSIGAVVRADVNGKTITRQVDGGSGQGNQNDQTLHFGLGSFSGSVPLEITWMDGTVENITAVPNQRFEYFYGGGALEETAVYDIGEVGKITNLTHASQTITLNRSYENPVVFAQSASNNESQAAVARVTNVQSDRFTIYLAESSDSNGPHASETVTYVVLEAGRHLLPDGSALEVGLVDTAKTVGNRLSNSWESVSFESSFSATPVVLSQVQTTNGSEYLKTRYLATSGSSILLALEQQESIATPSVEETVGYLALSQGTGTWNSMRYDAGVTPNAVTDAFYSHSFGVPFQASPSLLTSLSTYDSGDNGSVRYSALTSSSVQLKIDEDKSYDAETAHTTEAVSYLAIDGEGMLTAQVPQLNIGEVGKITNLTHSQQTVSLIGTYVNPVVFAQSASANDSQPAVVRVTNVQSDQFTIYLAEPSNQGSSHGSETVTYVVMEAGRHRLADGTWIEAGTVDTTKTVGNRMSNSWEFVSFESSFSETPVVLSQIQTTNGAPLMQTRYLATSASSVLLALELQEQTTTQSVQETVGYFAIEPGTGTWSGLTYEAAVTSNAVTNAWYQVSYGRAFESAPSLLTSLSTYDSGDNSRVRYTNSSGTGVQLKVEEDTTFDSETAHTTEAVAFFAIGGEGRLTAPLPPIEVGEVGSITNLTHQAQTIQLDRDYVNPVVFAQSASTGDSQPAVVRVSNVQSGQFTIQIAEPSNQGSSHGSETVTYVVLEAGTHQLSDGTQVHVGTVETSATVGNRLSNSWESVIFSTSFGSTPVVLSQVQTNNTSDFLQTRYLATSSSSFIFGLEQQESVTSTAQTETVGYLAISEGTGTWNGLAYEAGKTNNAVTDSWHTLSYDRAFEETPNLLTSLSTYDSGDNAHVRYRNSQGNSVQLKVEEDTSFDAELAHTTEAVAFLAIGGEGILTASSSTSPPRVIDFQQNGTAGASNLLSTLTYTFDEEVVVAAENLYLANANAGFASIDLTGVTFNYDPATYTATWYFDAVQVIGASTYEATLDSAVITDMLGNSLDGDGDGIGGDDYTHMIVIAGAGDANADGNVDASDFGIWNTYKFSTTGQWNQADFNGDGVTDVRDFNIWNASKFSGQGLVSATSSSGQRAPRAALSSGDKEVVIEPDSMSDRLAIFGEIFVVRWQTSVIDGKPHPLTVSPVTSNGHIDVLQLRRFDADRYFGQYRIAPFRNGGSTSEAIEHEIVDAASIDATLAEVESGLFD